METIIQFLYGFAASIAFALIFHTPSRALSYNGIVGGVGWIVYRYLLFIFDGVLMAAMITALLIGTLSAIFGTILKLPTLIIYIPSLIPLVPGGGMYYTMYYLIMSEMELFSAKALETTLIAISLATGIFISTSTINLLNRIFGFTKPAEKVPKKNE